MAILSKVHNPNNFEPQNCLKLSFTSIRVLCSNVLRCESLLESNSPDILALCETNLEDSIDSSDISMTGYIPLIRKFSITHLAVYVKEGLLFARNLFLENSDLCFRLILLHSISYFFFLYQSPSFLWTVYSRGTDRPGELCYIFSISNDLIQMVNSPTRIFDVDSHSPALLDLFLSSDPSISSMVASPPLGNADVVIFVSIVFPPNSQ